jgi:hypothetical protein
LGKEGLFGLLARSGDMPEPLTLPVVSIRKHRGVVDHEEIACSMTPLSSRLDVRRQDVVCRDPNVGEEAVCRLEPGIVEQAWQTSPGFGGQRRNECSEASVEAFIGEVRIANFERKVLNVDRIRHPSL